MIRWLSPSFRNSSLQRKLVVSLLLLLILPLFTVALILNVTVSGVLNTRIADTDLEILKQTRYGVENLVHDTRLLSLEFLSDDGVQGLIQDWHQGNEQEFQKKKISVMYQFQNALYTRPWIASISLSDGPSIVLQAGQYLASEPTDYHQAASDLQGVPLWTGIHVLPDSLRPDQHRPLVSLVRSVFDLYHREQIATLRISLDEAVLSETYRSAGTVTGGELFVIDGNGSVISSPRKELLATSVTDRDWYGALSDQPEGWARTSSFPGSAVFQYKVQDTTWRVVQIIPESELNRQTTSLNAIILICMVLCVLFGVFFWWLQDRTVLAPLQRITVEMEKLKLGDFNVALPVNHHDEIGKLSRDFLDMAGRIKELVDTVYRVRLKEKEAALMSLESQINPHFLYNTLDAIRWMAVRKGDLEVSEQIEALSALFRHTLNLGQELTTLGAEVAQLENYLLIQKNRFGDRFVFHIAVGDGLSECRTVKLVLQPLVENAIVHGLEPRPGPGTVWLVVEKESNCVKITVRDNGVGTEEAPIRSRIWGNEESHNVFALKNIHERIQLRFGARYGLDFRSSPGNGTTVTITLPLTTLTEVLPL